MTWSVDIDGTDITSLCQTITWRPKLNRPASLVVRVPGHLVSSTVGVSEMHLVNGDLLFSGPVWYIEDEGDPDTTYTQITAYDHLIYMTKRLCKTGLDYDAGTDPVRPWNPGPCNLADPRQVILDFATAPAIMGYFITAANDCDLLKPGGTPFPITVASVAAGGDEMGADIGNGLPVDFPMTLQAMLDMLLQTANLNILVNPGYGSSSVDLTNGGVVNDLSGSVVLSYQTGSFNSQTANRTRDMEEVTNALWYLLGPHRYWYTGDISHWTKSITPTAPFECPEDDPDCFGNEDDWPPELVARWMGSRAAYGYFQEMKIIDANEDKQVRTTPWFQQMYAGEAYLRAVPRQFAGVKPERESGGGVSFMPGDRIGVAAGTKLGGGFSGSVIVYEHEITIDADGVAEFTDLVTSDNQ